MTVTDDGILVVPLSEVWVAHWTVVPIAVGLGFALVGMVALLLGALCGRVRL